MEITVEYDTSNIAKLPEKWQKAKAQGLNYSAQTMVRFLMQNSPVDHGLLKQWFIESLDEEEAHIKSPAEYAIYQDQGTKAHMIRPVNAQALHWDGGGSFSANYYTGHVSKLGVFSKGHMIKGIQGKHFVDQSFNELSPLVPGFFLKALEESD